MKMWNVSKQVCIVYVGTVTNLLLCSVIATTHSKWHVDHTWIVALLNTNSWSRRLTKNKQITWWERQTTSTSDVLAKNLGATLMETSSTTIATHRSNYWIRRKRDNDDKFEERGVLAFGNMTVEIGQKSYSARLPSHLYFRPTWWSYQA